jgi:signal transduction histidine kinase
MTERKGDKSIAFRLNFKFLASRFSAFLLMDIIICFIFSGALLYNAEQRAASLALSSPSVSMKSEQTLAAAGFTIHIADEPAVGFKPPIGLSGILPEGTREARRSFTVSDDASGFLGTLEALRYRVMLPLSPQSAQTLTIMIDVGKAVMVFTVAAIIVLIWQALLLLFAIRSDSRDIARILQPLRELTATTQTLSVGGRLTPEELKKLAGALDSISAAQLDKRLPLTGVNEELQPLAMAINEMLQRIDEAYRSQIQFISDASHELRTPIAVIQGYASLLSRWGTEDPATTQESVNAIKSEADSMKELVERLLFLARGDNDSMHVVMERLNLSSIAAEVLREVEMIDPLHIYAAEIKGEVWVLADSGLIKQLMRIIIDNSIKHTPAKGRITLIIQQEGKEALLAVRDEGEGINPQDLPHVFDRFYRADSSRNRDTGGAGLGLAIAKWIIERHGGYFKMMSMEQMGTKTAVYLPMAKEVS